MVYSISDGSGPTETGAEKQLAIYTTFCLNVYTFSYMVEVSLNN